MILIGTTLSKPSAYTLHKFLQNQLAIQREYPSKLIIATSDDINVHPRGLDVKIIKYPKTKPPFTDPKFIPQKERIWDMVAGRNAVREYFLQSDADYLLSLDADMLYDKNMISILMKEIKDCDVVMSGYKLRTGRIGYSLGCALIKREVMGQVRFRCLIYRSSQIPNIIEDGCMFEHDCFVKGFRIKRGLFVRIVHLFQNGQLVINPRPLTIAEKFKNASWFRYLAIKACMVTKRDLPKMFLERF